MIDYSQVCGQRIISVKKGAVVGTVKDVLVDFDSFTVIGFIIGGGWNSDAKIILFSDVESIGEDVMMVSDTGGVKQADSVKEAASCIKKNIQIIGLEVITNTGHSVGTVSTFHFSQENGKVSSFEIKGAGLQSVLKNLFESRGTISVDCVISIGKDVLIVSEKKQGEST